jgi:PAS domain S-box-containing protein
MSTLPRDDEPFPGAADSATHAAWHDLLRADGRIGLWTLDPARGTALLDPAARRLWALPDAPQATTLDELRQRLAPTDRARWDAALASLRGLSEARAAAADPLQVTVLHPDGRARAMALRWRRAPGVAATGWLATIAEAVVPRADWPADSAEAQLALAAELGDLAVWRHDLAGGRMQFNDQAFRILGIPPRPEGLSVAEVRALVHPEDLQGVLSSAEAALNSDRPTDLEARYRRADGRWREVLTRRRVQRDAGGRPIAFVGVALDVTERLEQQRRAEEATRRFELVTRAAGIGHWTLEGSADRATWGPALRAIYGLADDEPVPTWHEWIARDVHPQDRDTVRRAFAEWSASGRESLDLVFRILRRDGSVRQVISHTRVEARAPTPLLFGVVIDVSERVGIEQALRSARERARLAAHAAGIATWEQALNGDVAYWDEQMWTLRGHAPQPGSMSEAERLACVHPEDRERVVAQLSDAQARGAALDYEFRVVWPDGQVRWLASRSVELDDPATGTRSRIGVNWDVTDRRRAEAAWRERELALRESQAKSKFLARMSHELRTPLNAVLGFAQLLLSAQSDDTAEAVQRRKRLEHIRGAGQHLLSLINDVLDLARVEGGELQFALRPVSLAPLVAETLPLMAPQAQARGVQVRTGPLAALVLADATRLRQALLNLLSNAIKYNRDGGTVTLEAETVDGQVRLRVTDSGCGLSPQQLRHLFEPFNRLGAERGSIEGTGIGLAIVKALVERMGGSVHVTSQEGVGSVFELRLAAAGGAAPGRDRTDRYDRSDRADASDPPHPSGRPAAAATGSAPAPSHPAAPATAAAAQRRHLLLYIEDNPVNAQIIRELVGRRGDVDLVVAPSGSVGVMQAATLRPELVLLDMQLPDFDGFEVLRRLRADPAAAGIPVVALSANAMPEDIRRALDAGMADYWTKPLDFGAFMSQLARLFGPAPAR